MQTDRLGSMASSQATAGLRGGAVQATRETHEFKSRFPGHDASLWHEGRHN
jgi:hypothetical protein